MDLETTRANRIIFNNATGNIIAMTGEARGNSLTPHEKISSLGYVDLEYGSIDYSKYYIKGINVRTRQPILEEIPVMNTETDEQRRIKELEEQLRNLEGK